MKTFVLDSSVLVKWVSRENEQDLSKADQILKDIQSGKVNAIAPELAKYEIGNALLKKKLTLNEGLHSLGTVYSSPVQFVSETEDLASETYKMTHESRVKEESLTYYDASFTALAKQEDAVLITSNPKHQTKVKGVKVVALKDYR